mgnify:CR=1 FL=1
MFFLIRIKEKLMINMDKKDFNKEEVLMKLVISFPKCLVEELDKSKRNK